jgi:deoxyribonuclease-4
MRLGAHIGISEGFGAAITSAQGIGCESVQIFSKSPQMWAGPPLTAEGAEEFRTSVRNARLGPNAVHHGYLVNLASPKRSMVHQSRKAFVDELRRAEQLGVDYLIFHPGAHLGSGVEAGLQTIVKSLDWAFAETPSFRVRALLENSSGQGTALCGQFEELAYVLSHVQDPKRAGVTLDTCHLFANGFDLRSPETYGQVMDRVEATVGRNAVYAFHLNDAKAGLGSHLDRHENIGKGELGTAAFAHIVNDLRWSETPGYLETPLDDDDYAAYARDLGTLKGLRRAEPSTGPGPETAERPAAKTARRSRGR